MKFLILILIFPMFIFADMPFKETRYIDSIDSTRVLYGALEIKNDVLSLVYTKPNKETIIYDNNKMTIQNNGKIKEYLYTKYPHFEYMKIILTSITEDNYTVLNELFMVKISQNAIFLEAKKKVSKAITSIEILKNRKQIETITINMSNSDKITIETIH